MSMLTLQKEYIFSWDSMEGQGKRTVKVSVCAQISISVLMKMDSAEVCKHSGQLQVSHLYGWERAVNIFQYAYINIKHVS